VSPLAITAAGLACSLGLGSERACAASRAGLVRVSQVNTLNTAGDPRFSKETLDGVPPFVGHLVPVVGAGYTGIGKLVAIGRPALEEVLLRANLSEEHIARTCLCVCISDGFYENLYGVPQEPLGDDDPPTEEDRRNEIAVLIASRLCNAASFPIPVNAQWVSNKGRLGLLGALHQSSQWFATGKFDRCIVGTLDSFIEPAVLEACCTAQVLKTEGNPVGFMPGEAAAFLLVEPSAGIDRSVIRITGMAHAVDSSYHDADQQPLGHGISQVVRQLVSTSSQPNAMPGLLISDLNGTDSRALDWGHAMVHLRDQFGEFESKLWLPVESFGETGAASGGVALCLAFEAIKRAHMPANTATVLLCAEGGGRAAIRIEIGDSAARYKES
jgi:3-oxoacyl-[acyl-carrier-protein] synthase I